ncbi:hypothetical protein EB796_000521 [Bugula neritina]|uniref:RNA helicase n=1 Tax=Bugula neritina TaxID=10212 RepID=A0A7J7KSW2_BUGNE|nr:hypothetical protein EB796_000521 [Bugula neritina]
MHLFSTQLVLRCPTGARHRAFLSCSYILRNNVHNRSHKRTKVSSRVAKQLKLTQTHKKPVSLAGVIKPSVLPSQSPNTSTDDTVALDFAGPLSKADILAVLNQFFRQPEVKSLAMQQGMEHSLFLQAFSEFRKYCATISPLPSELHIKLSDIINGYGTATDLFPFFLQHAKVMYPHLDYVKDLRHASNLTSPAQLFPLARAKQRKIIIHAGPTNSGKTYHAFQRYLASKSGIYCGPLKMLAVELAQKSNDVGIACDLVTGEERNFADPEGLMPAAHISCTVEMTDIERPIEVAIIDEIQMLRDKQRGWAWLRAFLGVNADEVHLCGEEAVIDLIKNIALDTGDTVEVKRYKRLTPIEYMNEPLGSIENVQDGDCIVCFNKSSIYQLCRELEKMGRQCAVIYGGLPPGTKLAQASRFNDPDDPCKVLIATDAIGMGINLNIRRVIFYSLLKIEESRGSKINTVISPSQALQIAGRCGRYGTTHKDKGYVTTFHGKDLELMHDLLNKQINPIDKAGIHPTADMIELYGYYLPHASLSDIIDIFLSLMTIDGDKYFLCQIDQFKQIAEIIEHIEMPLRTRYVFCCAPIPLQSAFVTTMLLKYARQFSAGQPITGKWLAEQIGWPLPKPITLNELTHLEAVHDSMDLYNWLSYRFEDQFPDKVEVKDMQMAIDKAILEGVCEITKLVVISENNSDKDDMRVEKLKTLPSNISRILEKLSEKLPNET